MIPHCHKTKLGELFQGDCREILKQFPDNHFTTVITDPPYELTANKKGGTGISSLNLKHPGGRSRITTGFMGKAWDGTGVAFQVETWAEVLRVCKPGAMLMAFGGTRTYHRLVCAIEDAGWKIRDSMMWLYGSGFPKSLDVGKAIDKAAGVERKVVGVTTRTGSVGKGETVHQEGGDKSGTSDITLPETSEARVWNGYGTALKPAYEPIVVAMAPLDGTFSSNAIVHGVAGLNIDAGRIDTFQPGELEKLKKRADTPRQDFTGGRLHAGAEYRPKIIESNMSAKGRWPANIILSHHPECECVGTKNVKSNGHHPASRPAGSQVSGPAGHAGQEGLDERSEKTETVESWACHPDCPIAIMDSQSGERPGCKSPSMARPESKFRPGQGNYMPQGTIHPDTGFASRFFYCAKASRAERQNSTHPTIKPLALIEYLVKLTSPPADAHILDCFIGSGTLALACENLDVKYTGIDLDCGDAINRISNMPSRQLGLF